MWARKTQREAGSVAAEVRRWRGFRRTLWSVRVKCAHRSRREKAET